MELRTFIKETLKDVMGGVSDAQAEIESGIIVPPTNSDNIKVIETGLTRNQIVSFEVAVNTSESEGLGAKINVVAAVFSAGVSGESSNTSGHTAKLSFKVPVQFSEGKETTNQ